MAKSRLQYVLPTVAFVAFFLFIAKSPLTANAFTLRAPTLGAVSYNGPHDRSLQTPTGWSSDSNWDVVISTDQDGVEGVCVQFEGETSTNCQVNTYPGMLHFYSKAVSEPGSHIAKVWYETYLGRTPELTINYNFDNVIPLPPSYLESWVDDDNVRFHWQGPDDVPKSGISGYVTQLSRDAAIPPPSRGQIAAQLSPNVSTDFCPDQIREALGGNDSGTVYLHVRAVSGSYLVSEEETVQVYISLSPKKEDIADLDQGDKANESSSGGDSKNNSATNENNQPADQNSLGAPPSLMSVAAESENERSCNVKLIGNQTRMDRKGSVTVKLKNIGERDCSGPVWIIQGPPRKAKRNARDTRARKALVMARGRYLLKKAQTKTVKVHLTKKGQLIVKKQHSVDSFVTVNPTSRTSRVSTPMLIEVKK